MTPRRCSTAWPTRRASITIGCSRCIAINSERIPLIRRQDVRGFVERQPVWLARPLGRYMDTPFWSASLQVMLGGLLVFAAGILIGSA
jgi:hypothetical protein